MTFSEQIAAARRDRGWSLREAAVRIGISHTYLLSLEKGDPRTGKPVVPSADCLLKLCNAYGLSYREVAQPFYSVNEGDLVKFLVGQLRVLRRENNRLYRRVLRDAERDSDPE